MTTVNLGQGTGTLSDDNLSVSVSNGIRISTESKVSGKWYLEVAYTSDSSNPGYGRIDIGEESMMTGAGASNSTKQFFYSANNGIISGILKTAYGTSWKVGDVVGVLLDINKGDVEFTVNGVSQGILVGVLNQYFTLPINIGLGGASSGGTRKLTANFGATPFQYSIPVGYTSYDGNQKSVVGKSLVLHDGEYKKYIDKKEIQDGLISMVDGSLALSTASSVTRALHVHFDKDITLKKVSYKAGYSNTLGFRIYNKNTKALLYKKNVAMAKGYNTFTVDDIKLLKDEDYLIGFYGANIYGRTITSPVALSDLVSGTNLTIYSRYDASSDTFPTAPVSTTYPIMKFEFTIEIDGEIGWLTVEGNQIAEQGMDSLRSIPEYKAVEFDPTPMIKKEQ